MKQNSNYDKLRSDHKHYIESSLGNIYQNLMETIADFLDSESVVLDEAIAGFSDPEERGESTLHERMAKAAIKEYELTMTGRILPTPDESFTRGQENDTHDEVTRGGGTIEYKKVEIFNNDYNRGVTDCIYILNANSRTGNHNSYTDFRQLIPEQTRKICSEAMKNLLQKPEK